MDFRFKLKLCGKHAERTALATRIQGPASGFTPIPHGCITLALLGWSEASKLLSFTIP